MLPRIICLAVGYVCGLFQTSYIYGKKSGIDIREHGSGNAGTTNALRTLGKKAGALTLLGDCLKCVLAVLIARLLFGTHQGTDLLALELYAGAGCILGHNFPFYLKFKGGKGIAASVGFLLAFDMRIFLICAVLFFGTFFPHTLCIFKLSAGISGLSDFCGHIRPDGHAGLYAAGALGGLWIVSRTYLTGILETQTKYCASDAWK